MYQYKLIDKYLTFKSIQLNQAIEKKKKKKGTSHSNSHCSFESPPGVLHMKPET